MCILLISLINKFLTSRKSNETLFFKQCSYVWKKNSTNSTKLQSNGYSNNYGAYEYRISWLSAIEDQATILPIWTVCILLFNMYPFVFNSFCKEFSSWFFNFVEYFPGICNTYMYVPFLLQVFVFYHCFNSLIFSILHWFLVRAKLFLKEFIKQYAATRSL